MWILNREILILVGRGELMLVLQSSIRSRERSESTLKGPKGGGWREREKGRGKGEIWLKANKIFAWRNNVILDRTIKSRNVRMQALSASPFWNSVPCTSCWNLNLTTQQYSRKDSCNYTDNCRGWEIAFPCDRLILSGVCAEEEERGV